MKLKRIIKVIFLTICFIFAIISCTSAKEGQSMKLSLSSDNSNYNVGDIISIKVNIEEVKGFSGINTFAAKKVYDDQILEYIEATVENDNWEVVGDAANIVLRKMEGEDLGKGSLCTLKFKVIKNQDTNVKLSEVDACNDEGDVYFEDENVNAPEIEIKFNGTNKNLKKENSYIGIILISIGMLGLAGVGVHYIINKNK